MRRALVFVLLALTLASTAHAQSSTGKFAVFMQWPGSSGKAEKSTGVRSFGGNGYVSQTNAVLTKMLGRMGVPYTIFDLADSAGGWARVMGATRPAGTADSTWFRQKGYIGQIFVLTAIETNSAPIRFFTDGASQRGTFAASPLAGWSTPTLCFVSGIANNSDSSFTCGIESANGASGAAGLLRYWFHDNGDSVAFLPTSSGSFPNAYLYNLEPSQSADVTRLVDMDTLSNGNGVAAWRYKSNVYYVSTTVAMAPMWGLYGVSQLFRACNYTPKRKLNVHWSLDHVYPRSGTTWAAATSDTFFTYIRAMNLKFSGLYTGGNLPSSTGNGSGQDNTNTVYLSPKWDAFTSSFPQQSPFMGMPHSHRTILGFSAGGAGANVDLTNFADTATTRGYFNMMERAVSDTMKVRPAKGFYKTIGMPNNQLFYPWVYILTQNSYTDLRVSSTDSIGFPASTNLYRAKRIASGPAFTVTASPTTNWGYAPPSPWWYGDPTDASGRRGLWIHEEFTPLGDQDSTWANVVVIGATNDVNTKNTLWLSGWARAAIYDTDFYFHPQENLIGASNGDQIVNLQMRRTLYFYNRVSNIVTQDPAYRPRTFQ